MGLRPGRCDRNPKKGIKGDGARGHRSTRKQKRPWTRIAIRVPRKNYIGAAPALRIRQFNMGNPKKKYTTVADLRVREGFDLRDNAIESSRMAINRYLVKELGKDGFFMKVRVYPSNILRENKLATGAGADRMSLGMSLSFGKPVGRSARLKPNQVVFSVLCTEPQKTIVKKGLMRAKSRFASDVYVDFHKDIKSVGTLPNKKQREEVKKEATTTTEKKGKKAEGKDAAKKEGTDKKAAEKTPDKKAEKTKK